MVTVKIDVLAGPDIEAWTMDAAGFRKFEKSGKAFLGGEFEHYPGLRMTGVRRNTKSVRLGRGRYYVVLDNSDRGDTKPPSKFSDDKAHVRITINAD